MTPKDELELFARIPRNQMEAWLAEREAETVKVLAMSEGAMLHRAQGKFGFIEEMKKLLAKSKDLR